MADYGLLPQGFILKRLQDILADSREDAAEIFQDLVGPDDVVDTSDSSTLGRMINLLSVPVSELWETAQLVNSAFDPNSATGIALDNLVQYSGIQRQAPTYSNATAIFTGDTGTTIPINSIVGSTVHPNTFRSSSPVVLNPTSAVGVSISVQTVQNEADYTISYTINSGVSTNTVTYTSDVDATENEILSGLQSVITSSHPLLVSTISNGFLEIEKAEIFQASDFSVSSNLLIEQVSKTGTLIAEEVGPLQAEANSLNVIKTPVLGWDTVTNPLSASLGNFTETDDQLRLRFRNTKFERSSNIMDSLYSALISLDGVESVTVYENDTDVVDPNGLPPHSFTPVVLGGDSEEIAETIWRNKPMGIGSNGNTSVDIIDSQGFTRAIDFERPSPVTIYVTMDIQYNEEYPADGADQIRSAIIEYARENFGVGEDIIWSRLYTPINSIPGHQVDSLFIGISPSPTDEDNIDIGFNEIGSFQSVNIIVNATEM